jgi:hypothetical protein
MTPIDVHHCIISLLTSSSTSFISTLIHFVPLSPSLIFLLQQRNYTAGTRLSESTMPPVYVRKHTGK